MNGATPRPMTVDDIDRVQEIEQAAYEFPWSIGVFKDCLRVGYSCWVVADDRAIHGYGIMSVAAGESHILNLCIAPTTQRHGLGERLLRHLCEAANGHRAQTMFLEVRPSNGVATRLYERHSFRRVGLRRDYYPHSDGREDAYVYALDLAKIPWRGS
ncbi:MAG: ribosomal-protein-alanine N-acetyltransferase [Gammaproteobacteria bacterium]|jgi:ribosomal-protein-alanine N-acetyltransferase